jgi:hypothetical protein
MEHVWVLLLKNELPRVIWDLSELSTDSMMPLLPVSAWEDWVRAWNGSKLEFGIGL